MLGITKDEISSILKERIDNFELNIDEPKRERGIVVNTPVGCFDAIHAAIATRAVDMGIQLVTQDDYLKQDIPDLPLIHYEDFDWDYKKHKRIIPKVKTEVDNEKIQQAIAKRVRKIKQKELYHESIKKHSRI